MSRRNQQIQQNLLKKDISEGQQVVGITHFQGIPPPKETLASIMA
jgi:hypothetical protein